MTHGRGRQGRRYYLQDVPLDEAKARYWKALSEAGSLRHTVTETVPIQDALGRITAAPVWAARSAPHYDSAAMDGVAVLSRDTAGATETSPRVLTLPGQARWVDTGEPVPDGFDAVIMIEVVQEIDESTIQITSPVPPYNHVRPLGEDIVASELLLPENHKLRPADLGGVRRSRRDQSRSPAKTQRRYYPDGYGVGGHRRRSQTWRRCGVQFAGVGRNAPRVGS